MTALLNLTGKKGLVLGIADEHSIAYGCAKVFREAGADFAVTYANEKAKPYVKPLAEQLGASIIMPCNVRDEVQIAELFQTIAKEWGENNIRVNALSPSAIKTRAGSGLTDFDGLLKYTAEKMPLRRMIELDDIGNMAAFLVSDLSKNITGCVHMVDGGYKTID